MTITTLSSRDFNQDTSRAKKAASDGPVFITDRDKPAHMLLTIEEYQRITGRGRNIVDSLSMPGLSDIKLPTPCSHELARPADLSYSPLLRPISRHCEAAWPKQSRAARTSPGPGSLRA